jgi:hypothetical protein
MDMEYEKPYTENIEEIRIHREIIFDYSNSLLGNKWGKENYKFFREFGSIPCDPCTKDESQLSAYPQDKQDPNPRIRMQ